MPARTNWYGNRVKKDVNTEAVKLLTKMVITGENRTKIRITEAGRIKSGLMRSSLLHDVDPVKLRAFWGSPIKGQHGYEPYPVYQEMGTSTISPMYAFRGALDDVKKEYR